MRLGISLLIVILALSNVAFGAVGDVGVSDGSTISSSQDYMAGSVQQSSVSSISTGYQVPLTNGQGYSGFEMPQSLQIPQTQNNLQTTQGSQAPQGLQMPQSGFITTSGSSGGQTSWQGSAGTGSSAVPSYNQPTNQQGSAAQYSLGSQQIQTSGFSSGAPQTSGPYQEHFSPTDLSLSQPQAESFNQEGDLGFAAATPPTGMYIEGADSTYGQSIYGQSTYGQSNYGQSSYGQSLGGAWYYPGSVKSRNKMYVQTSAGLKTVAGCRYAGYMPLWSDIATSGNFYVYEWYPGQWTPSVRWWGWTWPGFKRGWFNGDAPGWHVLCYNCNDWSNYVYIYVWPGSNQAGSSQAQGYSQQGAQQGSYQVPAQTTMTLPSGSPTPPNPNAENLVIPDYNQVSQYQSQTQTQSYNAVFPKQATSKCNQYYIQIRPGQVNTVSTVKMGEWLPLWSKICNSGCYWSFEWTQCGGYQYSGYSSGLSSNPDVKSFGAKGTGWCQTWFRGNTPGWHILCYCCNDWSNYIYIYVMPVS